MNPILVGVPWDATTLGRKGAQLAPAAIREELRHRLHPYDAEARRSVQWEDAGDARVGGTYDEMLEGVTGIVSDRWRAGPQDLIGFLGGDHAVAYAGIRAVRSHFPDLTVLSLDSHLDLRPQGRAPSNGNWALRMIEDFHHPLVEVGRGRFSNDEGTLETAEKIGVCVVPAAKIREQGVAGSLGPAEKAIALGRDVYLSIDIDVVHQAAAPGVSAPSVDGISVEDLLEIIGWASRRFRVRAFDMCEVNPSVDPMGLTARLAGYVVLGLLSQMASEGLAGRSPVQG
jgi:formiminoglutamase